MPSIFSKRLSQLRHDSGLGQRQTAAELGISQALLSHYENGAREPKLEFVLKACEYYKASADYLLGRSLQRDTNTYPSPLGCERAPQLIAKACEIFRTLDELTNRELYAAAVDYLLIPIDNIATHLSEPNVQYDPMRDVELKMAEAAFIQRAREGMEERGPVEPE